ncbi:hypothetical protein HDV03_003244, partial [Kappamyces sp. JEL0829]
MHSSDQEPQGFSATPAPEELSKIAELQAANRELSEKIELLEDAISNLKADFSKEKLELSVASRDELQQIKETLSMDSLDSINTLEQKLALAVTERDALTVELSAVQQQLDGMMASQERESALHEEIIDLKTQLDQYQVTIEVLQSEALVAQQQIIDLTETKALIEETNDPSSEASSAHIAKLQHALDEHLNVEKSLRAQIANLVYQLDKAEESEGHNQQELSRLRSVVESQKESLSAVEERLKTLELASASEVASLLEKIARLESELAGSRDVESSEPVENRMIYYRAETESLRKENQQLANRIKLLEDQAKSGASPEDTAMLIEDLRMVNHAQLEEMENLRQQARRNQQADDLKIAQLQLQNEEYQETIRSLQDQSNTWDSLTDDAVEVAILRQKIAELTDCHLAEVTKLKTDLSTLEARFGNSNSVLVEELQAINEAQVVELQAAQYDIENLKAEISTLKAASDNPARNESELIRDLQLANEEQMFELETLRISLDEQKNHLQTTSDRAKSELRQLEDYYQGEIQLLKQQLIDLAEAANDDLVNQLQLDNESYIIEIETLKIEMESIKSSYENQISPEEVADLKETIATKSQEVAALVEKIQELRDSHFMEVRELQNELSQASSVATRRSPQLEPHGRVDKDSHSNGTASGHSVEADIELLTDTLKELTEQNSIYKSRIEQLEAQLLHFQDKLSTSAKLVEVNTAQYQQMAQEHEEVVLGLQNEIQQLKSSGSLQASESASDLTSLHLQLEESEGRVTELESIIEANTAQYQQMAQEHEEVVLGLQNEIQQLKSSGSLQASESASDLTSLHLQLEE